MRFNEEEILLQLDQAFNGVPDKLYPAGGTEDIKYNFFLDLEHGYFSTAGSRIHLYADATRWAIVFEKSGYQNRATSAEIELNYIGNCIDYPVDVYPERKYISNTSSIGLIEPDEFARIENKVGSEMETFELIGPEIKEITIRGQRIAFENDHRLYEKAGIRMRDYYKPNHLVGFEDVLRYLHEMHSTLIEATDDEIRRHIPQDIPKLMTIKQFHFVSAYDKTNLPSTQETYRMLAKILVTKDTMYWKPTLKPNNSWKNWESGNL